MSEERVFEPTPHRLQRARRDGDTPRSSEAISFGAFFAASVTVQWNMTTIQSALSILIKTFFQKIPSFIAKKDGSLIHVWSSIQYPCLLLLVSITLPYIAAFGASCIVAGFLQKTFINPIRFQWSRISPLPAIKKMCSRETFVELWKTLIVAVFFGVFLANGLYHSLDNILACSDISSFANVAMFHLQKIIRVMITLGLIVVVFEARMSYRQWRRRLWMTFNEIKREIREQNGDPYLKGHRRRLHRRASRRGVAVLRKATVIITNPQHLAIALQYDPPQIVVPIVLARGADHLATVIRSLAKELNIPLVENVSLARFIYDRCGEGDPIPAESFDLVAPIIAAILRSSSRKDMA